MQQLSGPALSPPSPPHHTHKQSLAVTNGSLLAIPAELAQLSGLRNLDLHKNELQIIPPSLCSLTGLTVSQAAAPL